MNATDTRTTGIKFAKFLRSSADLIHRAADNNVMYLIDLEAISMQVDEFIEAFEYEGDDDVTFPSDDEGEVAVEEEFYMDEYDEP